MKTPAKSTSDKQTATKAPARQPAAAPKKSAAKKPASDDASSQAAVQVKTPAPAPAKSNSKSKAAEPAAHVNGSDQPVVTLRLYVAGQTPKSLAALANLRKVCDEHLVTKYKIELEIIDLFEKPQLAAADQILAIPTLVRKLPSPIKKIIGDLSNKDRVLLGLDISDGD